MQKPFVLDSIAINKQFSSIYRGFWLDTKADCPASIAQSDLPTINEQGPVGCRSHPFSSPLGRYPGRKYLPAMWPSARLISVDWDPEENNKEDGWWDCKAGETDATAELFATERKSGGQELNRASRPAFDMALAASQRRARRETERLLDERCASLSFLGRVRHTDGSGKDGQRRIATRLRAGYAITIAVSFIRVEERVVVGRAHWYVTARLPGPHLARERETGRERSGPSSHPCTVFRNELLASFGETLHCAYLTACTVQGGSCCQNQVSSVCKQASKIMGDATNTGHIAA
ncbi:hypothetical protein A9K55_003330, partial [Cordyceps militaris]